MAVGLSLLLLALGAVIADLAHGAMGGVDLALAGWVLILVGASGLAAMVISEAMSFWRLDEDVDEWSVAEQPAAPAHHRRRVA